VTTLGIAGSARSPSGLKVAPLNYDKIEQVAQGLLKLLPTAAGNRFAIDAWRILEQTLPRAGFSYHVADSNELSDCAAFTIPERKLVVLRQDIYDGLFTENVFSRSTVVHELSHIVLDHATTLHRGAILGKHEFFEDSEWQAKALTAATMMPLEACRIAVSSEHLAQMCCTSQEAAGYRLNKLRARGLLANNSAMPDLFSN